MGQTWKVVYLTSTDHSDDVHVAAVMPKWMAMYADTHVKHG